MSSAPLVMKFGGSSVADAVCMKAVAGLVQKALPSAPLVVLSAMGKTTDALFRAARMAAQGQLEEAFEAHASIIAHHRTTAAKLLGERAIDLLQEIAKQGGELATILTGLSMVRELSPRSMDAVACHGERLSTLIFARYLAAEGIKVELADARRFVRTDAKSGSANPLPKAIAGLVAEHVTPHLGPGRVVVTQGYIGATTDGLVTTLGRGGSDYSAALLGAALGATEVQIWTDVEGVLTCDPRVVPEAKPIPELSFAEAAELAAFGAKVLHPATILPAVEADIPVTVRSTMKPEGRFSVIRGDVKSGRAITALATRGPVAVVTVTSSRMLDQPGFLARLFDIFGRNDISVDLVATAEISVSMTVDNDAETDKALDEIRAFASATLVRDRAIVAVVGEQLRSTPGIAARTFKALGDLNVEMISMGANEINLSLVLRKDDAPAALRRLHAELLPGVES